MRRTLIAGNWKMNGCLSDNHILLSELKSSLPADSTTAVAICVPSPYLAQCQKAMQGTGVHLGAQDVSAQSAGAFTGEIAPSMLKDFACRYVIVGHSERRSYHGETSQTVGQKAVSALKNGLIPIVCVGETLDQRESGQTAAVVQEQLNTVLDAVGNDDITKLVIAYEPVWAIGTGKTATPAMAQEVHALLRSTVAARDENAASSVQILYGGSMKPDNARELLAMPDIDGGLIGGAALKASDFVAIISSAQ